ncbi:hypothetical protein Hamer_G020216, partial [Homarus americanus]
ETVKKNLDQSTDGEGSCSVPFRVTRSTPHPPLTASNSPPMPHSAKKLSKRLMMKKALLLQTKAKSLRIQERKNVALRRSDIQAIDSTPIQGPIVATRLGSSVSNQDSRLTRMTRSQAEVKHDGTEDKTVEEEQKEKLMEKNEKRDIGKIGKSEDLSQESS